MLKFKSHLLLLIFLIGISKSVASQKLFDLGVQSPTASAIGEFSNSDVNLYTGKISPSINLINLGPLSISLKHNYNGFKPEKIPGHLGLGWSMHTGGLITRTVQSIRDENSGDKVGYLNGYSEFQNIISTTINDVKNGDLDGQPDVFYYSLLNKSGSFFLDKYGDFQNDLNENIKIEWINPSDSSDRSKFKIIDDDGTEYLFGSNKTSELMVTRSRQLYPYSSVPEETDPYISSWYLNSIKKVGMNPVTFGYEIDEETSEPFAHFLERKMHTEELKSTTMPNEEYIRIGNEEWRKRTIWLKEIAYRNVKVKISYISRTDFTREKLIDSVLVLNNNRANKLYTFHYEYIGSSGTASRPILKEIKIFDSENNQVPGYKFNYESENSTSPLPNITTFEVDHWGYYNGEDDNINALRFLPEFYMHNTVSNKYVRIDGMVLEPNHEFSKIGLLNKITYPTGGSTNYLYEPNTYSRISNNIFEVYKYEEMNFQTSFLTSESGSNWTSTDTLEIENPNGLTVSISTLGFGNANPDCQLPNPLNHNGTATLTHQTNGMYDEIVPLGETCSIYLEPGKYLVDFERYNTSNDLDVTISRLDKNVVDYLPGPGFRIKEITEFGGHSHADSIKTSYTYNSIYVPEKSSGVLVNELDTIFQAFFTLNGNYEMEWCSNIEIACAGSNTEFLSIRKSGSVFSLGSTQGEFLGYKHVQKITYKDDQPLKNVFQFTAADVFPDIINGDHQFPNISNTSQDFGRGILLREESYNSNDQLIQLSDRTYDYKDLIDTYISPAIEFSRLGYLVEHIGPSSTITIDFNLFAIRHNLIKRRRLLEELNTVVATSETGTHTASSIYSYDSQKNQVRSIEYLLNDTSLKLKEFIYAHEEYSGMESLNMLSQPYSVELIDPSISTSDSVLSKTWTRWKDWGGGVWRPCETLVWDGGSSTISKTCSNDQ